MSEEIQDTQSTEEKDCKSCPSGEKGTTELIFGAGLGTYGTAAFLMTGFACAACMILTPALIGVGAYKRIKFNKSKQTCEIDTKPDSAS